MNENDLDTSIIINQSSVSDLSKAIESLDMSPLFEAAKQIQETLQKIFTEEFRDSLNQLSKTISSTLNSINSSINQVSKENFTDVETKLDHKSDYLMPDSFTYSNAESDDQTNELDEIKLMFIELCEKMEERETKASQNDSDNN